MLSLRMDEYQLTLPYRSYLACAANIPIKGIVEFQRNVLVAALDASPSYDLHGRVDFEPVQLSGVSGNPVWGILARVRYLAGPVGDAEAEERLDGTHSAFSCVTVIEGLEDQERDRLIYDVRWLPLKAA